MFRKYKILLEYKVEAFSKYTDDKKFHENNKIKFKLCNCFSVDSFYSLFIVKF